MKKTIYIVGINLCVLLVLLVSIEMVSRLVIPQENIAPLFGDQKLRTRDRPFVQFHETRGFALKPGFSNGFYSVNSKGFRGKDVFISPDKTTILALGESTTFGWGVKDDEKIGRASCRERVCHYV